MKNLSKILILFGITLFGLGCSLNKIELPKKTKEIQAKILYERFAKYDGLGKFHYLELGMDVDGDKKKDCIFSYTLKKEGERIRISKIPFVYWVDLNGDNKTERNEIILDLYGKGLSNAFYISRQKRKSFKKTFLESKKAQLCEKNTPTIREYLEREVILENH